MKKVLTRKIKEDLNLKIYIFFHFYILKSRERSSVVKLFFWIYKVKNIWMHRSRINRINSNNYWILCWRLFNATAKFDVRDIDSPLFPKITGPVGGLFFFFFFISFFLKQREKITTSKEWKTKITPNSRNKKKKKFGFSTVTIFFPSLYF